MPLLVNDGAQINHTLLYILIFSYGIRAPVEGDVGCKSPSLICFQLFHAKSNSKKTISLIYIHYPFLNSLSFRSEKLNYT